MWVEIEDDDKPDICTCNPEDFEQGHLHRSAEEIYANAKLIAAAPDLLNALIQMLDAYEIPSVRQQARDTIAKATGE
jgi:hypothetical protein